MLHPLGSEGGLLILEGGHYVGEEFVAVMLEYRREFIIYLLFNMLWLYYNGRLAPAPTITPATLGLLFDELLVVFLQKYELIKFGEGRAESELVSDAGYVLGAGEFFLIETIEEVLFQLVYGYEALEAGIHIAEVGVVLETHNSI